MVAWKRALQNAYRNPLALLNDLDIEPEAISFSPSAARQFPFLVPRPFAARMRKGDINDPLLKQVLPIAAEITLSQRHDETYSTDPVGDRAAEVVPGLLRKFEGRALFILSGACAINCRYCFRRHYPYAEAVGNHRLSVGIDHIAADPSISEVILSGGDPLTLSDEKLSALIETLATIPHISRLRIHTRLPIVIPERVTDKFITLLTGTRLRTVVVVHVNHAQELDEETALACAKFSAAGIDAFNQTVLLRGINDDVETLVALSEALFAARVLPYYIHLLDAVTGAQHFDLADATVRSLAAGLRARLPGYLVPRFVREITGEPAKLPFV